MTHSFTDMPAAKSARGSYKAIKSVLLLVLLSLLLWQFAQQQPRLWNVEPMQRVQLQGEYYELSSAQLGWLEAFSTAFFADAQAQSRASIHAQIHAHLETSFARVGERLPLFADWYYSLPGEYSRFAMALLSAVKLAEGDFIARRAADVLFPDALWQAGLQQLELSSNNTLLAEHAKTRAAWLVQLQALLAQQRVPAPLTAVQQGQTLLRLDELQQGLAALEEISLLDSRVAISSLGAVALAGPALWRAVAARNAVGSARVVASGGARGGARLASAAGGAIACAPGGPLAIACAAGVGVATWLAADWLLLQADEALHREQLLQALQLALDDLRSGLEAELTAAYDARVAALHEATELQIRQSFSLSP